MYIDPTSFYPVNQDKQDPEIFIFQSSMLWVSEFMRREIDRGAIQDTEHAVAQVEHTLRHFLDPNYRPQ